MRNVWVIARREYNRFFTTSVSYAVAFAILLIVGLIFALVFFQAYNSAFSGGSLGGPTPAPDVKITSAWFTIMLVFSVPALTMRLISDENRMGTLELLLTAPLQDWELIVGKWLGGMLFILTVLAVTLLYPVILNLYETSDPNTQWQALSIFILSAALLFMFWNLVTGKWTAGLFTLLGIWVVAIVAGILLYKFAVPGIDWGLTMANYLGLILASAAFLGLGVGISSLFSNQVAAFFATLGIFMVLWWILGFIGQFTQGNASNLFNYLDMGSHFNNDLSAGTINISDVIYYLSITALGLFTGTVSVETRRWN